MKRLPNWIVPGATLLFAAGLAYEPLYHLWRGSLVYSLIPQDDFYYYYLTAKNLALHGFSSFDGIVPTNGYHPLWMWCLSILVYAARGNDGTFFVLLEIVQVTSAVVTAGLILRLFKALYGDQPRLHIIALATALLLTVLIFLGMETVVVIPLYLLFCLAVFSVSEDGSKPSAAFRCGLIGTLLVLARLDTLIAIALAALLFFFYRTQRKKVAWFLIGLSPLVLYFISNKLYFGGWLPVSAEAKQLSDGWHFSFRAIEAIGTPRGALYFALTIIGCVLVVQRFRTSDGKGAVRLLIFVFPLLFALFLAVRLSWSSYVWYFYPYPISAAAGFVEIREQLRPKAQAAIDRSSIIGLIFVLLVASLVLYRDIPGLTTKLDLTESHTRAQPNIYIHALEIKPFTDSHPGRYAMGDRGGLTAFLTGQPILQLEGLAADQAMVDSIATRADLLNVLRKYGVHYYIVSYPLREFHEHNWHWDLYEPHKQQVQPWAPVMHGRFYAPEVFRFPAPVGARLSHADSATLWVTRVLDISQAHPDSTEGK